MDQVQEKNVVAAKFHRPPQKTKNSMFVRILASALLLCFAVSVLGRTFSSHAISSFHVVENFELTQHGEISSESVSIEKESHVTQHATLRFRAFEQDYDWELSRFDMLFAKDAVLRVDLEDGTELVRPPSRRTYIGRHTHQSSLGSFRANWFRATVSRDGKSVHALFMHNGEIHVIQQVRRHSGHISQLDMDHITSTHGPNTMIAYKHSGISKEMQSNEWHNTRNLISRMTRNNELAEVSDGRQLQTSDTMPTWVVSCLPWTNAPCKSS